MRLNTNKHGGRQIQNQSKSNYIVGVISDTHGLLRKEAVDVLQGVDLIIHAGDVGDPHIINKLENIARVVAVRGNMDREGWAYNIKKTEAVEVNGYLLYVLHDLGRLDLDPSVSKCKAVISGHSHRPSVSSQKGVLYVNPGSAGPRRFKLPVSVALLRINGNSIDAEIVKLNV